MRRPLLWIALSLVSTSIGMPQVIEQPSIPEEPTKTEGDPESIFCQMVDKYNCNDSESSPQPPVQSVKTTEALSASSSPRLTQDGDGCGCVTHSMCANFTSEGTIDSSFVRDEYDNEALYAEFPWMVGVVRPERTLTGNDSSVGAFDCGGSLIHPQVVLTTAHCVDGEGKLVVRAGEWDTLVNKELYPTQDRNVRQVIVHERFYNRTLHNDLALLILDEPVDMSLPNVGLVCLPEANENMDNRSCVVSGWGKDSFGNESKFSEILKRVDQPMVTRSECLEALRKTRLGHHFKLHESFVCAGGIPNKGTCQGDEGGPLVCPSKRNPTLYVQAGIVAWVLDCGTKTPGVYVSVPYFIDWIHNKLQAVGISL